MSRSNTEILDALQDKQKFMEDPSSLRPLLEDVRLKLKASKHSSSKIALENIEQSLRIMHLLSSFPPKELETALKLVLGAITDSVTILSNPLSGQTWFIERMKALNYTADEGGCCYGMSYMAMQAFLAQDMETFNARLHAIQAIPLEDYKNEFLNLRNKQKELIEQGKPEEAEQINEQIVNTLAFFDGIALHQDPKSHKDFFENPDSILRQDAKRTSPLTLPIALDSDDTKPVHINTHTGAYTKDELTTYLTTLEENLGKTSFSLALHNAKHAINLNYNAQTKRWLIIDPNHLPGKYYLETNLLANELFSGYQQTQGLVLETSLYATNSNANKLTDNFEAMKQTITWQALQNPSKLNTMYEDEKKQVLYALDRDDATWIHEKVALGLDVNQIVKNKKPALMYASTINALDSMKALITDGAKLEAKDIQGHTALTYAVLNENIDAVKLLIESGAKPTHLNLREACRTNNLDVIKCLIKSGIQPTEQVFNTTCEKGKLKTVQCLLKHGMKPSEKSLLASAYGDVSITELLIEHGAKPTTNMLQILRRSYITQNTASYLEKVLIHNTSIDLNLENKLTELNIPNDMVQTTLVLIEKETIKHLRKTKEYAFNENDVRRVMLEQLETLTSDKNSTLGSYVQANNLNLANPAVLSSEKTSTFKEKLNAIKSQERSEETTEKTADKDNKQDNTFNRDCN